MPGVGAPRKRVYLQSAICTVPITFISCRDELQLRFPGGIGLACPFFMPREIVNDGSWPHPARLPLGAGWTGVCGAPAQAENAEAVPKAVVDPSHIRDFCNLGYANACPHLPFNRDWDAIRFSIAVVSVHQITICYACELNHAPIEHGTLTYNLADEVWRDAHPDERVRRLAASFLHAYRMRQATPLFDAV